MSDSTANPFASPRASAGADRERFVPDWAVLRLLADDRTEDVVVDDTADTQLYGRRHARDLEAEQADSARKQGLEPVVYQAVYWMCFVYAPVVPLQTCYVIKRRANARVSPASVFKEQDRYRLVAAPWDHNQTLSQGKWGLLGLLAVMGPVVGLLIAALS